MFDYKFSRIERCWLLGLRLAWQHRERADSVAGLIDRLFAHAGVSPCGVNIVALLECLEREGAQKLYLERFDQPGLTGDERDLITALKACYLDDPLAAEAAMSALLPPGHTDAPLRIMQAIAGRPAAKPSWRERMSGALNQSAPMAH